MNTEELLKQFGGETVKTSGGNGGGKSTPIIKIADEDNPGLYLRGVFLEKKAYKDKEGKDRGIYTFRLIETNAPAVGKGKEGYAPVTVKAGDEVCLFGPPTRLQRALEAIELGMEVLIVYEGKKKVPAGQGKTVRAHEFKVGKKPHVGAGASDDAGVPD